MDDIFESLINLLDSSSKFPALFECDVKSDFWLKCQNFIENIRNDDETFKILQEYYISSYSCFIGALLEDYWQEFSTNVDSFKENFCSQHRYIFPKIDHLHFFVSGWLDNPLLDIMFDEKDLKSFIEKLHQIFSTALITDMPLVFSSFLYNTFAFSFEVLDSHWKNEKKPIKDSKCIFCNMKITDSDLKCHCENLSEGFIKFLNILRKLGIFHTLCDDIIKSVLYDAIEKHISELCKEKNFDMSCLSLTCTWFENNVIDWLKIIYIVQAENNLNMFHTISHDDEEMKESSNLVSSSCLQFKNGRLKLFEKVENLNLNGIKNFLTNTYIYTRMKQLFDIIIDYPYSEPALLDLHECIKSEPFYRETFTFFLKNALEARLLHAGVPTGDIIEAYITTIKALKLLDPQGFILQIVCDPVRNYLRTRDDTIRSIIAMLTNEDLINGENSEKEAILKENPNEDELILETWKSWIPQNIGVSKINKELNNSDIVWMLINIFDSKDLFVIEYQRVLAQKLILSKEVNLEYEIRNLEILSLRFGESDLHNCEIMLKDLKNSERINHRFNSDEFKSVRSKNFKLNGLILSKEFWPDNLAFTPNEARNFRLPPEINEVFESYKKVFENIKVNRTLNWVHQLGTVELEIEFKSGTQEYSVKPIQAAIINLYQKQKVWKVSAMVAELDVLPSVLRRNIAYWKNSGVLKELPGEDAFEIVEEPTLFRQNSDRSNMNSLDFDMLMDEDESIDDQKNNLQICWNFIDNMLKNLQALPLDRIYTMIKMFNMQSSDIENLSIHELRNFLDQKVKEGKLIFMNGLYKLNDE